MNSSLKAKNIISNSTPPPHNGLDDIMYEWPPLCITLISLPTSLRTALIC